MGVTLGASSAQSHPDRAGGGNAIHHGMKAKFEGIDPSLLVEHGVAMEASGDDLVRCSIRQHVASQLLDGELIKWHVLVECLDHPVAKRPNSARAILFVTIGVSITGKIQPRASPSFPVWRRLQKAINEVFIGFGILVLGEIVGFLGSGRQAYQVEIEPANQGMAIRLW